MLEYRNVIREVRDLLWQPETVNTVIDQAYENIAEFSPADIARWRGGPAEAGSENIGSLENQIALMKSLAFTEDLYMGNSLPGGRAQWLSNLAIDPDIPGKPTITRHGNTLISSPFTDPQGAGTFGKMQWRIAEVSIPDTGSPDRQISSGDSWSYFDSGTDPGPGWTAIAFDDSRWPIGETKIGYGDEGELTRVTHGHAAVQFRKLITIDDPAQMEEFQAGIVRDDGAVVYVNGIEVWRNQMPGGPVTFETLANAPASGANERDFQPFTIPAIHFAAGDNVIAVEVHQHNRASDDMGFNFQLDAVPVTPDPVFEWHASWTAEGTEASITPPAAATRPDQFYRARVRHQDTSGRWGHWSEPVEFFAQQPDISDFTDSLVISEIMYHPIDPSPTEIAAGFTDDDDFEFIEIRNVGSKTIDLSNVRFTKGIDIDLSGSIKPGGFILIASNLAAFEMRYGPASADR